MKEIAMNEIKESSPSDLVLRVTGDGNMDAVTREFGNGTQDRLEKPDGKNALPAYETMPRPEKPPSTATLIQHRKIRKAVDYINDNYHTDIRRSAVAGKTGMSPSHFSRMFRKVMGVSYQEYVNSKRIAQAKKLLSTSPRSITEIAVSLGFSDQTGFGRIFKKLTGHTPSAYRSHPQS